MMFEVFMSARSFLPIAVMALLVPVLAGCETVDRWVDGGDHVTINNAPASDVKVAPAAPVYGSAQPTRDELRGLASKMSGGSVEVYDIDGGPPNQGMISIAPQYDAYPAQGGMAYPSDPSVTVFPLDDFGGMYPPQNGGVIPMTPAPFSDVPDAAIGGKPHSSAGKDMSRVYFEYGSDRIGSGDDRVLSDAAEAAKFAPIDRVRVEGHASIDSQVKDPVKARILNLEESMNRAYKVSRRLIEKGVPAEKIKTVAWGDTIPSGGNESQRRVDIITSAGY
jgi:outer membrane protein OmpA-like peptidoglycan-associated protein